jgi:hypothetical protein
MPDGQEETSEASEEEEAEGWEAAAEEDPEVVL